MNKTSNISTLINKPNKCWTIINRKILAKPTHDPIDLLTKTLDRFLFVQINANVVADIIGKPPAKKGN